MASYTDVWTKMSRIARQNCHQKCLMMHIIGALAFRRTALPCIKAMITQMGFHGMPPAALPEGCAARLVNPLDTFSRIAAAGRPSSGDPGSPARPALRRRAAVDGVPWPAVLSCTERFCPVTWRPGPARAAAVAGRPGCAPRRPAAGPAPAALWTFMRWCERHCAHRPGWSRAPGCPAPARRTGRPGRYPSPGPARAVWPALRFPPARAVAALGTWTARTLYPSADGAAHSPRRAVMADPCARCRTGRDARALRNLPITALTE